MRATSFTHLRVHAHDLDESARFYKEVFGVDELPAPEFPFPVRWLRVGDLRLHLFQTAVVAPRGHQFGLDVDDFEAAYDEKVKAETSEAAKATPYLSS